MSYNWTGIRCGRTTENGAQTRLGFALEYSRMTFFRRNGAHLPENEFRRSISTKKGIILALTVVPITYILVGMIETTHKCSGRITGLSRTTLRRRGN
jgi:hypothetical protein